MSELIIGKVPADFKSLMDQILDFVPFGPTSKSVFL